MDLFRQLLRGAGGGGGDDEDGENDQLLLYEDYTSSEDEEQSEEEEGQDLENFLSPVAQLHMRLCRCRQGYWVRKEREKKLI